jgi:hypothetical protein
MEDVKMDHDHHCKEHIGAYLARICYLLELAHVLILLRGVIDQG